jgi:hypothetical protein
MEEMEELYVEGLATRGGPESCVDDPRGRGEALTGARAGRVIEPRNHHSGVPQSPRCGRQHRLRRYRELLAGPARSENQGMYGIFMRENRESPCLPVRLVRVGGSDGRKRPGRAPARGTYGRI